MVTRTVLLYLSRQHKLKNFFSGFPGFKQITRRFIAGENIDDAIVAIRELNALGITASFDHLGESISSEAEAEADVREYLHVIDRIAETRINSNISIKPTQLGLEIDEDLCLRNVRRLVEAAKSKNNFVRIDMEDSTKTDATLRIFHRLRSVFDNVGIVLQAYLYRTEKDLRDVLAVGGRVRLCKGEKLPNDSYEFQMLYGIRRDLQIKLAREGYRMRTYVPYGEYWYPYFMRRLAERPANIWFVLKSLFKG
jgi:proline dehydrogenase